MENNIEFKIFLRRKIPYVSEGLYGLVIVFSLIILLFYILMLPTKNVSAEMATAYYLLVIPEWLKTIVAISLIGLIIFFPFYYKARLNKPALLTIENETFSILGMDISLIIPFKNIKRIYFNDLQNLLNHSKEKLQIVVQQKNDTLITFLLANYEDADLAIDYLGKINNAEFAFFDKDLPTIHDDE